MALSSINLTAGLGLDVTGIRVQLTDLQRQMSTGRKAATFGALGGERMQSLSLRQELGNIQAYRKTIMQVTTRVEVRRHALERTRSRAGAAAADLKSDDPAQDQQQAMSRFIEMVALLNSDVAGRYLFGGRDLWQPPVAPSTHILEGADGKAGFKQVAAERLLADLGADGLGGLAVDLDALEVTLSEDADGSPFGFKLDAIEPTLTGTVVTPPAGSPPEITVTFSAVLPEDGETLRLDLDLPDGTTTSVTLKALPRPS